MLNYNFSMANTISYQWCGKFKAPTSEWIHMTRELPEYELFLMTEGTLYIADNAKKYIVAKDEYLFMPPTEKQYGYAPSDCSFFWLHFSSSSNFVSQISQSPVPPVPNSPAPSSSSPSSSSPSSQASNSPSIISSAKISSAKISSAKISPDPIFPSTETTIILPGQSIIPNIERIAILINQLQDADRRYHHKPTTDMLATGIILELYNQIQAKQATPSPLSFKNQLYQSILDYISWNKFNRISVLELSEYFGYHVKYLSSVFKSIAGIPLKQYILQEIMEHAKAELMNTNKTISQIGNSIGYTDSHNFSHAFKKVTGITPTEYRISCNKLLKTP